MAEFRVFLAWKRTTVDFVPNGYDTNHEIEYEGDATPACSAAPGYGGDSSRVDPEEAFIGSLSSCHMLTLLAVAARRGYTVDEYTDEALGVLSKNEDGRMAMTQITLRPRIRFGGQAPRRCGAQ